MPTEGMSFGLISIHMVNDNASSLEALDGSINKGSRTIV